MSFEFIQESEFSIKIIVNTRLMDAYFVNSLQSSRCEFVTRGFSQRLSKKFFILDCKTKKGMSFPVTNSFLLNIYLSYTEERLLNNI